MILADSSALGLTERFLRRLVQEAAVLVQVTDSQGSVPREAGTWMAVFAEDELGTIGGGHLEFEMIALARAQLLKPESKLAEPTEPLRFALGPSLGQCCGGVVCLTLDRVDAHHLPALRSRLRPQLSPVALFGGGHVGQALVQVLARLPFQLAWIDSRDGVFPDEVPEFVCCEHSEPVQSAVRALAPQSLVLVMSFSHAEDLDIIAACLQRLREKDDLPFIGLIGSKTKWATFQHRLEARGFTAPELARVTCPIGIDGIAGKEPAVIAVAVAAQLLQAKYRR